MRNASWGYCLPCLGKGGNVASALSKSLTAARPWIFFFQAEDGIRDTSVTGVQTCALPIWLRRDVPGRLVRPVPQRAASPAGRRRGFPEIPAFLYPWPAFLPREFDGLIQSPD